MSAKKTTKKKKTNKLEFAGDLDIFYTRINGLMKAVNLFDNKAKETFRKERESLDKFVTSRGKKVKKDKKDKSITFKVDFQDQVKLEELLDNLQDTSVAIKMVPRSIFTSMISQFDLLVSEMMRVVLKKHPGIISKERSLNYEQLLQTSSIKEAREYFVEDEIDSVLRGDHAGHIDWFEKKIKIKLKVLLGDEWGNFIEMTERRNLFVHANGIVNTHYINNCRRNGVKLGKEVKVGEQLTVSPEYLKRSYNTLYQICTKLSWSVWTKLKTGDRDAIDAYLNNTCVKLIRSNELELAENIFSFLYNVSNDSEEVHRRLYLINLALSKKLQGDSTECCDLIDSNDWSMANVEFLLAINTLKNNYEQVYELMKSIPKNSGFINKDSYKNDPLYTELRKQPKFKKIYKSIYKEEYFDNTLDQDQDDALKLPKKKNVTKRKK